MATLKVFDGTSWQVVAGQGPPAMNGVPAGGAAGTFLTKNTAANHDLVWTDAIMRWIGAGLYIGTVPAAPINVTRLRVNPLPWSESHPAWGAIQSTPSQSNVPALSLHARGDQAAGILWTSPAGSTAVGWGIDKYARPQQWVQAGSVVVNTDAYGNSGPIYYPEPFLTTPVIVTSEASVHAQCTPWGMNNTFFHVRIKQPNGNDWSGGFRINWFAFETRSL